MLLARKSKNLLIVNSVIGLPVCPIISSFICLILAAKVELVITIVGCSGGSNKKTDKPVTKNRYYYKWSNGMSSASDRVKPASTFISFNDDENSSMYNGSEIPPFSSLDDAGEMGGYLLIFTYYDDTLVNSTCICDSSDGEITEYDLNGNGFIVPSFVAKKRGIYNVTATYNNETLIIPVRIYRFQPINLPGMDLDGDGILDINNFQAKYGYQVIDNTHLSLIFTAPIGDYLADTPLTAFMYNKIYVIKTSSGRYCKIWPTGYCGEHTYNSVQFLSDTNGQFDY
jgi:hypothetical protein